MPIAREACRTSIRSTVNSSSTMGPHSLTCGWRSHISMFRLRLPPSRTVLDWVLSRTAPDAEGVEVGFARTLSERERIVVIIAEADRRPIEAASDAVRR